MNKPEPKEKKTPPEESERHLKGKDLERACEGSEPECDSSLDCNDDDCFVHGSELDASPEQKNDE